MDYWRVAQGSTVSYIATINDANGNPVPYIGNETLAGQVWPGGLEAVVWSPALSWYSAGAGQVLVPIAGTQTAALAPSLYRFKIIVTDGGGSHDAFESQLEVLYSPGSVGAPPTYTSIDDLYTYADWILDLQASASQNVAGFLKQQGRARSWLDDMLVSRWKWNSYAPTPGTPGYGSYSLYGGRDPFPSKWLRDQLATWPGPPTTNPGIGLIVRDQTKEIVAKKAISLICASQIGRESDRDYRKLARYFAREAEELAKVTRCEIDLNNDGYADLVIDLGSTNLR